MSQFTLSTAVLFVISLVSIVDAADPAKRSEPAVSFRDLAYVPHGHVRQKLDLYLPNGPGPFPVLVWIHGGAWRAGDKGRPPGLGFLQRGAAVVSLNYRLSQHAIFPAQIEDCKAAIRWLRAHANRYGLDADRLVVWGASAGGHLAALLGTTGDIETFDQGANREHSSQVTAVIDEFGPTDFLQMDVMDGAIGTMDHDAADSPESRLIGGPIQDHPETVKAANPITYVSKTDPPFLIIHGDHDPLVAYGQSVLLYDALKAADVDVELYTVRGGQHGGFQDATIERRIQAFVSRHLTLTP